MAERCIKGDYIGFTFDNIHSSELGLMRVSDGSRYEQDLLPPLQDKKVQVAGRDGEIYFNSQYNTKPIKVSVAFDNMNEESFQKLKRLLADKKPRYLWFDETPYKQWLVKPSNVQKFKWVCFDDSKNSGEKRIYKGEGTLEFNCFTPYAESRVTFLDEEVDSIWVWNKEKSPKKLIQQFSNCFLTNNYNYSEWKEICGLRESTEYQYQNGQIKVYNAGDKPTNTFISFSTNPTKEMNIKIYSSHDNENKEPIGHIIIKPFNFIGEDNGFIIDSKLKMIKGTKDGVVSGNNYSKYHVGGDYFKIPVCCDDEYYIIKCNLNEEFTVNYKHYYI